MKIPLLECRLIGILLRLTFFVGGTISSPIIFPSQWATFGQTAVDHTRLEAQKKNLLNKEKIVDTPQSLGDSECFDNFDCDDFDECTFDYCNNGLCFHDPIDVDFDGVCDLYDNCPEAYNPDQDDTNGDGEGDECDNDIDGDGVDNEFDNYPYDPYYCQDVDNDGCDDCEFTGFYGYPDQYFDGPDTDADGICDYTDNCIDASNPFQEDSDSDGLGDECDNCDFAFNPGQEDTDGDGMGDACDDCVNAAPGIEHFNYTTCHCELGYYEVYEGDVLQGQNGELRVPIEVVVACNPCPPGYYCPDGQDSYPCPAGTFMDVEGAIVCNPCAVGYTSDEGATECYPLTTCADGILNGLEEGIDCGGPDCAPCPPPEAVCGVITVYVGGPDYDGPGSQNVWLIPSEDLDAGSSSSSMTPDIDVLRYLSTITFNWTTMGACEDMIPNGTYNNPDKGTVYRDCYPAVPGNFNVWKLYKLRIQDEFGSDDCAGTVKVIQEPALVAPVIHLVIPDTDEYISTDWNAGLGLHENPESVVADLIVVPNPGRDAMQVNWSSLSEGNADITVVDMAGRRVISQNILMLAGENKVVFDMSSVTPGVYAILLRTENTVMSVKWIKD